MTRSPELREVRATDQAIGPHPAASAKTQSTL